MKQTEPMRKKIQFLAGIALIAALAACIKSSIKPSPPKPEKADTTKTGADTTKIPDPPVQVLPKGVFTTIGISSTSWIIAMHSDQPSESIYSNCVATDAAGSVYVLFNYYGLLDLDPGTNTVVGSGYTSRATLAKYSVDGKYLWSKKFNNFGAIYANKLSIDKSGNVYCMLRCTDADLIKFDNYSYTFKSAIKDIGALIKFDTSGKLNWLREIGVDHISRGVRLDDMTTDVDGNLYIGGVFRNVAIFYGNKIDTLVIPPDLPGDYPRGNYIDKGFWAKYNTDGKLLSTTVILPINASNDLGLTASHTCIAVDSKQNVFICGQAYNVHDVNVSRLGDSLQYGKFITKYDKNGKWLWLKGYGGSSAIITYVDFVSMVTDAAGNVYVSGYDGNRRQNNVVYKVDANGNDMWNKFIPTGIDKNSTIMIIDNKDQLLVAGTYIVTSAVSPSLTSNLGIYLNKYSTSGTLLYNKNLLGYSILSYIYLYNAAIDNQGNVNVTGFFNGSIKLLNTSGDPVNPQSDFNNSFFIAHFPDKP